MSQDLQTYDFSTGSSQEPIGSLIYALCEQARLGHKTETPFKLVLPSKNAPFFTVEHHGCGLTQGNLRSTYLNENATGDVSYSRQAQACFEYSGNFFVRTTLNGQRTEASFLRNVFDGTVEMLSIPSVAVNDELNKFSVTVHVKSCDIDTFLVCAIHQLDDYDVDVFLNGTLFDLSDKKCYVLQEETEKVSML